MKRLIYSVLPVLISINHAVANPTADYFARFKYDLDAAIKLLKQADNKPMADIPEVRNLLDDLGYWKMVRRDSIFRFTPELQQKIEAQYKYLQKAYTYEAGDLVWVKAEQPSERAYGIARTNHRAQIVGHERVDGTDFYLVDIYVDGPDKMTQRPGTFYDGRKGNVLYYGKNYSLSKITRVFTKSELDALNSPTTSLPKDNVGEVIDWQNDRVWREKLEQFKTKMANKNFEIDFRASPQEIESKQQELMLEIFRHFKMNRNAPSQSGRGLGLRASGGGVCYDQALVLTFAIQALGQTLGIKAFNLDGTTVNPTGGHGFVRYELKTRPQNVVFDMVFPYEVLEKEMSQGKLPTQISPQKAQYPGVVLKTSSWIGISDPGWADYGVTPDFFARLPVSLALNPFPRDANRAVNGMSSHRSLSEVAKQLNAVGPLNTYGAQKITALDINLRTKVLEEIKKGKNFRAVLEDTFAAGRTCSRAL